MTALLKKDVEYSLEDYIELEKSSEEKFEFFEGKVLNASNESIVHSLIISNIVTELRSKTHIATVRVFGSNLKIKVPNCETYRYADVTAILGKPKIEIFYDFELLTNPSLIVEVLSPSTEAFDLNDKFTYYKSIESFTEYLLVSQDRPHVVLYTKQDENVWLQREYNSLTETVYLTSLDCEIYLTDIYANIEFSNLDRPRFPVGLEREDR